MEDERREKREKEFFGPQPSFEKIKHSREKFLVSLRKKNKQQIFKKFRENKFGLGLKNQKNDEIDYEKQIKQIMCDFGFHEIPVNERFEKLLKIFTTSKDRKELICSIKLLAYLVNDCNFNNSDEFITDLYEMRYFHVYSRYLGVTHLKYEMLDFLNNLSFTNDDSFCEC